MKTLLAKFYKSLACRVALAIIATATVAKAHDLPQHFPLAPTDWGMIQQDCMGYQSLSMTANGTTANGIEASSSQGLVEFAIANPDEGNPPQPDASSKLHAANELIGPALYDGVDCAKLESYYRNLRSEQLAEQLVEYTQTDVAAASVKPMPVRDTKFEFHKSFFAACSCDFENQQANRSITPPTFVLKRTYIEDFFAVEFNVLKPLVLRTLCDSRFTENIDEKLAVGIPTTQLNDKRILTELLSQIASYDCIARSEFYSSQRAFELGEITGTAAKNWIADTLPSASKFVAEYARSLKPATIVTAPAPMFVIYKTAAGNEVAIPITQAKRWEHLAQQAQSVQPVTVSQEFKDMVAAANARLQWAGGRLSSAASYMNDWFSDRLARANSNDLR